jgi:hypothetical protein
MKTFIQFVETKTNRYTVRFNNKEDSSEIELIVIFPILSYIEDFLKKIGLWAGNNSPYPLQYKKDCMKTSPESKFITVPEENKINPKLTGNGLLKKLQNNALYISESAEATLVYSVGEAERLFKIYFKKLTGIEDDKYWTYWTDLNSGIQCLLKDGFSSIKHEIKAMGVPTYKKTGEIERVIFIKFAHDSSLEERKMFGSEFDDIWNEMPKTFLSIPIQSYEDKTLVELKQFITTKIEDIKISSTTKDALIELQDMVDLGIRKKTELLIVKS